MAQKDKAYFSLIFYTEFFLSSVIVDKTQIAIF